MAPPRSQRRKPAKVQKVVVFLSFKKKKTQFYAIFSGINFVPNFFSMLCYPMGKFGQRNNGLNEFIRSPDHDVAIENVLEIIHENPH